MRRLLWQVREQRYPGGLDQSHNTVVEQWSDLKCPLKVVPLGFADRLGVRREIEGGIQVGFKVLNN